eukprot:SM000283S10684  [mRNA]  locus=s283:104275:107663:+ [translate_table: standard]
MECNKDEAQRASELAELKLRSKDFDAAKKLVARAKKLAADLDGLPQLSAVVDVHVVAAAKVNGGEMDWYGILQVSRSADDGAIKKQFRKFALLLHPDKNNAHGANTAFQYINEAFGVLSDKSKRAAYDMKMNLARWSGKRQSAQFAAYGSGSAAGSVGGKFLTQCPACMSFHQMDMDMLHTRLPCSNCRRHFTAKPKPPLSPGANGANSSFQSHFGQVFSNLNAAKANGFPASHEGTECGAAPSAHVSSPPSAGVPRTAHSPAQRHPFGTQWRAAATSDDGPASNSEARSETFVKAVWESVKKQKQDKLDQKRREREEKRKAKVEKHARKQKQQERLEREEHPRREAEEQAGSNSAAVAEKASNGGAERPGKRRRVTKVEDKDGEGRSPAPSDEGPDGANQQISTFPEPLRRSSRLRRSISHKLDDSDGGSDDDGKPQTVFTVNNAAALAEARSELQPEASPGDDKWRAPLHKHVLEQTLRRQSDQATISVVEVVDPDYHNFDADRQGRHLKEGDTWALYDEFDGMPRFYYKIVKVAPYRGTLKVHGQWLESVSRLVKQNGKAEAENKDTMVWREKACLACGSFVLGSVDMQDNLSVFSHRVEVESKKQMSKSVAGPQPFDFLTVYPKPSQIWACFAEFLPWRRPAHSKAPKGRASLTYVLVEVLKSHPAEAVFEVAPLRKLPGYRVSFELDSTSSTMTISSLSAVLAAFSHQVLAHKYTGDEMPGITTGAWELDPAAIPSQFL